MIFTVLLVFNRDGFDVNDSAEKHELESHDIISLL